MTRSHKSQAVDKSSLAFYIYLSPFLIKKFVNDDLFRERNVFFFIIWYLRNIFFAISQCFNKQVSIIARQIVKYNREKLWNFVFQVADYMSSASKLARPMTMITHFIFTELFVTDVTKSGVIIKQFIVHCHYHIFWELNLFINFFDILFKCVHKYLRNIIIIKFFHKSNWLLRIECIVITLYVVSKSARDVFLIVLGVALVRVWLA